MKKVICGIVLLIIVLVIGLIVWLVNSFKDNEEPLDPEVIDITSGEVKVDSNTVLTIANSKYDYNDFIKYVRAWYEEGMFADPEEYRAEGYSDEDYIEDLFSAYQIFKLFNQYAEKYGVELNEDEIPVELSGDELLTIYEDYGITSGEFKEVQIESAKATKLYTDPTKYVTITDAMVKSYNKENGYDADVMNKTYKYRVVQVPVELENAKEKAQILLDTCKEALKKYPNGVNLKDFIRFISDKENESLNAIFINLSEIEDDGQLYNIFDYIGASLMYQRYTQNSAGFNIISNGALDSSAAMFLADDLSGVNSYAALFAGDLYSDYVIPFLTQAKKGDYSDVFVPSSNEYAAFIYMEDIENKLSEEDQNRLNMMIINNYIQSKTEYAAQNIEKIKNIKIDEIIPILARKEKSGEDIELEISK